MISRILVPVDFGEHSRKVLDYAAALADKFKAEIHLLHVIEDLAALASGPDGFFKLPSDTEKEIVQHATKRLEEYTLPEGMETPKKTVTVTDGVPFVEIIRYARENNIDLIVLGTHGRSGLVHMLMGSVAEKVIRKSPCPTLAIRPEQMEFELP